MSLGRICCILLIFAVIAGCAIGIDLKKPTLVTDQAERSVTIGLGESTREDVRAALGEPLLESNFWRVELYRADDKHVEAGVVVIIIPVLPIVSSMDVHGYVLVTYDTAGRVSQLSSGTTSEGFLVSYSEKLLTLRADELTFASDFKWNKWEPALLADSSRLSEYLAGRSYATSCMLVVACAQDENCPEEIAVDDGEPFDPSPMTVLCAPDAPCPKGSPYYFSKIDGERVYIPEIYGKRVLRVPLLHAITVPPGKHRLLITSSVRDGRGEASFECAAGQVLYGIVRSRVEGRSFWSKGKLQATADMSIVPPEAWDAHSIVLYSKGRWLVEPELDR